ncbi:hypothetical protein BX261_7304 [Streptomyces sp. 2321.6]|uniref:hypothetical protein n=1 Tax=Streptomyces sp. 2321.6 TaxID=1938840 RepID=UPI000BB10F0A|nr:hypothetical protein [Streptomyces sp. 2321.6]PBC72368.1 hypothetical protein BX261_7241 [Streptomyces sp. 2321.6]PBC72429.1 hypothetical protein BX261_7304 [Streptomyces sp. 2321.6]
MTDAEHDPDSERYAYSRTALARLALSSELRDLADSAAAGVPTTHDMWSRPGEAVGDAVDLVRQAQEVLARAVIYERQKHTSWEAIGEQLDMKKQSAHERYKDLIEEWKLALQEPFHPAPSDAAVRGRRLHDAAYAPTTAGRDLDQWVREHIPAHHETDHPVTGHLPALTTAEEMVQVLDALNHLYSDMHTPPDPADRARLTERKAALLDRIAIEEDRPEAAVQAEEARALAAQLRADIDGTA